MYKTAVFTRRQHTANKTAETRNKKHHLEGNAIGYRHCHGNMLLYVSGVNYNVNSKVYTKYFAELCCRLFAFWKISVYLVAPSTDVYSYNNCFKIVKLSRKRAKDKKWFTPGLKRCSRHKK